MQHVFWIFGIWATDTEISVKRYLGTSWMGWGQVDWVGRVLPEAKFQKNAPRFFNFFYLSDRYRDICKKLNGLGTSWLGGEGHPRSKIWKKCTLFLESFWFERPIPWYLLNEKWWQTNRQTNGHMDRISTFDSTPERGRVKTLDFDQNKSWF